MRELYEGLGAFVVDGGETFNPSISDLLAAIHEVPAEEVLVLPNNSNVVLAAERACDLSDKEVTVVDCTSPQAGLVGLIELDLSASLADNVTRIDGALAGIRVGSIAPAARDDKQGRFVIGDAVGFVGGEIVAWGEAGPVLGETLAPLATDAEIITAIAGDGAPIPLAELEAHAPDGVEMELHEGGQPSYWWLLAAQ
jgi:dihydroxyacetone kinase-like predicted kinase